MGVMKYIYGISAILLALDAMFLEILPSLLLQVLVVVLGVLILLTPMGGQRVRPTTSQQVRRFVFGAFIALIGAVPLIQNYTGSFIIGGWIEVLHWASIEVWSGQLILILIGVIYFFAGTKTGNQTIYSQ
ncbi:MAG: hypothetical protein AABX79_00905 [Nanoarchaeota archaeon]